MGRDKSLAKRGINNEDMIALRKAGLSDETIGRKLGCSASSVRRHLGNKSSQPDILERASKTPKHIVASIYELYDQGLGKEAIANTLRISTPTVYRYLRKRIAPATEATVNAEQSPNANQCQSDKPCQPMPSSLRLDNTEHILYFHSEICDYTVDTIKGKVNIDGDVLGNFTSDSLEVFRQELDYIASLIYDNGN